MTLPIYTASEVAAILGVTLATLPRKWRRLREEAGFPKPIPGRADAWSRVLVDEWLATPEEERALVGAAAGELHQARRERRSEAGIRTQRDALEARYVGGMG